MTYTALGNKTVRWTCTTCGASGTASTDRENNKTAELVAVSGHEHPVFIKESE